MSPDIVRLLTRKNSLRTLLRELNVNQIEKIMVDLNDIYNEFLSEKKIAEAAEEARIRKIIELKSLMLEAGIDPSEISERQTALTKKVVKPKYRLIDPRTGKKLEWTGRGRTPVWVQEYEEKGGNRKALIINS